MNKYRFFPPHVRFVTDENTSGGGDNTNDDGDAGTNDLGFPADTPTSDMTPEQKAAYWRHEAKKQQKARAKYEGLGDPDAIRKTLADAEAAAEKARQDAMSEQDRALDDAKRAARAEGAADAQGKWVKEAVHSRIALLTHTSGESPAEAADRVNGVLAYIDASQFVTSDGVLDTDKIKSFAESLGKGGQAQQGATGGDPLIGHLGRQQEPSPGAGGSVAALEQAAYDRLTGANN